MASADDFGPNQVGYESPPTAAEQELYDLYRASVSGEKNEFDELVTKDLAEFNVQLTKAKVPFVNVAVPSNYGPETSSPSVPKSRRREAR